VIQNERGQLNSQITFAGDLDEARSQCASQVRTNFKVAKDKKAAKGFRLTSASLIGRLGSSTFKLSTTAVSVSLTGSRFSSESAPRPFHHGIEDEAEQSLPRHCRRYDGGSKRKYELTSSIVPRGTSFHCSVELDFLLSRLAL
jgi:hypothetical protein